MSEQEYKTVPVNGARLRAARLTLSLGTRELGRLAGVSLMAINLMEKENRMGAQMTLAQARRIAEAAGLSLTDLLTEPAAQPESVTDDADAQAVIQLLAQDPRLHERDHIAYAFEWDIPRTDAAIAAAEALLVPVGLRIQRTNTRRGLRPSDPAAHDRFEKHLKERAAKNGMNAASARLLRSAILDEGLRGEPTDISKPNLGYLINVGALRPGSTGEPFHVATDDAAFAFEVPHGAQ